MENYITPDLKTIDVQVAGSILSGSVQNNESFNQADWQGQNEWI